MKNLLLDLEREFGSLQEVRLKALQDDGKVLGALLKSPKAKERFFTHIDNAFIFQKERFLAFLNCRQLGGSYTAFVNKIGLSVSKQLLIRGNNVALNFPYKDCVLKGAQSKDSDRSDEIFFNEILASDEIDVLFKPKALCNFEKYTPCHSEGVSPKNPRIANDTLLDSSPSLKNDNTHNLKSALQHKPNLLIKGNNLLALHTLKSRRDIYGQVKLIYIDPPYNTGNDSFNYNDRFNHSAWLVFMKNRLEIAREFLREDGVIFISMTNSKTKHNDSRLNSDFAYLWVLCDEIFGRENFICNFTWKQFHSVKNDAKNVSVNTENILLYAKKNDDNLIKNESFDKSSAYKYDDNDGKGKYKLDPLHAKSGSENNLYEFTFQNGKTWKAPLGTYPRFSQDTLRELERNNEIFWTKNKPMMKRYLSRVQEGKKTSSFWDGSEVGYSRTGDDEIKKLFGEKIFKNPKPEALLKRIIEISTKEGDLVMDFFAGSGTTCAVAHKMNRRWIGIEQMDYVEGITKERLIKVINGEQGGISKAVDFKGGGEFIYCELMPLNALYKEKIAKSSSESELAQIYDELQTKAFIDYRVDIQEMLKDRDFEALPLADKKKILYEILDSNMDYVAYSDMQDLSFCVDKEVQGLNRAFFKGGENG